MSRFRQFKRSEISELRPVHTDDIIQFVQRNEIIVHETTDNAIPVSISVEDLKSGSPKIGDMIARNPKNYLDQWLVSSQYFKDNFEPL